MCYNLWFEGIQNRRLFKSPLYAGLTNEIWNLPQNRYALYTAVFQKSKTSTVTCVCSFQKNNQTLSSGLLHFVSAANVITHP